MKFLSFTLVSLFAISSFASGLTATEINEKCLEILVKNADTVSLDKSSDVLPDEKLSDILNLLKKPGIEVRNNCVKISHDGIYQCVLFMTAKVGEVAVDYAVFVDADGETPANEVLPAVYISRGH